MIKKFLMSAMILLLLFTAGCENKPSAEEENNSPKKQETTQLDEKDKPSPEGGEKNPAEKPTTTERKEKTLQVKIYYPDDAGMSLVGVTRKITVADDADKYFAAVKLLTENPAEKNLTKIFPNNAKLNGVLLKRDTAFVNLDGSIVKNFAGGSTGEELLINSIVNTLTEFPEVKQVRILIDGKEVETLSGHMDLSVPLKRTI